MKISKFLLAVVMGLLFQLADGTPALAQYGVGPSKVSAQHAKRMAPVCPGQWASQPCLKATSESALVMAANYAGVLQSKGFNAATEKLKEHCAAATAAAKGEYPAYAMKSAYIECVNIIYDISEETGVIPDQSHYQLLVGPVLCLEEDRRCSSVEQGLKKYQ